MVDVSASVVEERRSWIYYESVYFVDIKLAHAKKSSKLIMADL